MVKTPTDRALLEGEESIVLECEAPAINGYSKETLWFKIGSKLICDSLSSYNGIVKVVYKVLVPFDMIDTSNYTLK